MPITEITKEELYEQYIVLHKSTRDVAKYFNLSQSDIRRRLKKYGIKARTAVEGKNTPVYREKLKRIGKLLEKNETRTCVMCEHQFEAKPAEKKQFCSHECFNVFRYLYIDKPLVVATSCAYCNKVIYLKKADFEYKDQRHFCSRKCISQHRKRFREIKLVPRILSHCRYCNKEIYRTESEIKNHIKEYCSKRCMAEDYSFRFSGENSPSWKGGKCKRFQYGATWFRSRRNARKRDNYTCRMCEITEDILGEQMSVHHIRPFRLFNSDKEANQLDNLVCLCRYCHTFVHSNSNTEMIYLTLS